MRNFVCNSFSVNASHEIQIRGIRLLSLTDCGYVIMSESKGTVRQGGISK